MTTHTWILCQQYHTEAPDARINTTVYLGPNIFLFFWGYQAARCRKISGIPAKRCIASF